MSGVWSQGLPPPRLIILTNHNNLTQLCSLVNTWQLSLLSLPKKCQYSNGMRELIWEPFPGSPKDSTLLSETLVLTKKFSRNPEAQMWSQMSDSKQLIATSLCSPLVYLNSSNLNAKSGDYCSLWSLVISQLYFLGVTYMPVLKSHCQCEYGETHTGPYIRSWLSQHCIGQTSFL